jgi:hypothetical protein
MKKNLMGLAMATERNTDNEKEVTRAPARDSKGVNGSANGCVATADEGMEVLPKNVGFVEDEGMEVDTTDRLQTTFTESEEIELLRCKSLDSVLFHKQEAQQNQYDDDDEEEFDGISDETGDGSSGISSSYYSSSLPSSVYSSSFNT